MSKNYEHLKLGQRYQLEALLKTDYSQKQIAQDLGVSESTISRELKRNRLRGGVYDAEKAQSRSDQRHRDKPRLLRFTPQMKEQCYRWLVEEKYSPELMSIAGKKQYGDFVSHELIYQWIWRCKKSHRKCDQKYRKLYLKLRHNPRRQKRGRRRDRRGNIPNRVLIDKRPRIVEKRKRLGDLEIDLMIGKKHRSAILIGLDRSTLKVKLRKLPSKESAVVKRVLINAYRQERWIKTITFDNDSAFMQHDRIGKFLKASTFFARPYRSQDKGSVENRIGQLRRFLPKKTDLSLVSSAELKQIENKLNNRPVRKFNYKTPNQLFSEKIALIS